MVARSVRCYAFFQGWLLLSLPSNCLRNRTYFMFTLSLRLGALTRFSVVPISAEPLIGPCPFPGVYEAIRLRSLLVATKVSLRTFTYSALRHRLSRPRRSCEILKRGRAICVLGWLFTPSPESKEGVARHLLFGPPPGFPPASTCSGEDRTTSRCHSVAQRGGTTQILTGRGPRRRSRP